MNSEKNKEYEDFYNKLVSFYNNNNSSFVIVEFRKRQKDLLSKISELNSITQDDIRQFSEDLKNDWYLFTNLKYNRTSKPTEDINLVTLKIPDKVIWFQEIVNIVKELENLVRVQKEFYNPLSWENEMNGYSDEEDESYLSRVKKLYQNNFGQISYEVNFLPLNNLANNLLYMNRLKKNYSALDTILKKVEEEGYPDIIANFDGFIEEEKQITLVKSETKNRGETKQDRVYKFSKNFILQLRDQKFKNETEVQGALKKIDDRYVDTQIGKNLLRPDGRPYEKRICVALSYIFEIKYNDTVDWTVIRDKFREEDIPISKIN